MTVHWFTLHSAAAPPAAPPASSARMPVRHPVPTPASSVQWSKVKRAGLAPSPPRSSFAMGHWKQSAFLFGGVTDRHGKKDAMYSELHNELYQFNLAACRWFPVSMRAPKGQVRTRPKDHAALCSGPRRWKVTPICRMEKRDRCFSKVLHWLCSRLKGT